MILETRAESGSINSQKLPELLQLQKNSTRVPCHSAQTISVVPLMLLLANGRRSDSPSQGSSQWTYETALASTATRTEAIREIRLHDQDVAEFCATVGDKEKYLGAEVLICFGY